MGKKSNLIWNRIKPIKGIEIRIKKKKFRPEEYSCGACDTYFRLIRISACYPLDLIWSIRRKISSINCESTFLPFLLNSEFEFFLSVLSLETETSLVPFFLSVLTGSDHLRDWNLCLWCYPERYVIDLLVSACIQGQDEAYSEDLEPVVGSLCLLDWSSAGCNHSSRL